MKKLLSMLALISLLTGVSGCSSSKIEPSINGKYFETDESNAVKEITKHISSEFKPEPFKRDNGNGEGITINSFDDEDGYGVIVFYPNELGKVKWLSVVTHINTLSDWDENSKTYLITLPSQVLSAFDVEEPERVMEACYADMADFYYLNGEVIDNGIKVDCHSTEFDGEVTFSVNIRPENATFD